MIDSQGDNPSPAAATHWTYTYDPIGNRTQSQYGPEGSEETTTYVANKLNQYPKLTLPTSQPAYQGHDADGNLTSEYGVKGGDSDCNGAVDFDDINYFVAALVSEASWVSYYKAHHDQQEPPCDYIEANDANGDHAVNFSDINPFVALIVNGAGDTARRYYYDAENRLLKFVLTPQAPESGSDFQEFYGYDYLGRRVFKQVDIFVSGNPVTIEKRRFIWDGWKLLEELDVRDPQAPAIARQYTWGLDLAGLSGAVNSLEGAGTIGGLLAVAQAVETHEAPNAEPSVTADDAGDFLFFYDGNGNVGQLVNWKNRGTELNPDYAWADARLAAAYEYDPYGAVSAMKGWDTNASPPALTTSGPIVIANRFRFSTKYFDANSGLHYFGYRYYSPRLGRWMSRDPIGGNGSFNLYTYVRNEPVDWADPLGLQETKEPTSRKDYKYDKQDPPCGYWVVCPTTLDLNAEQGTAIEANTDLDPKAVPGFEVRFFDYDSAELPDVGGVTYCCCACEESPPGNIRIVQVIKVGKVSAIPGSARGAQLDPPAPGKGATVDPSYPYGYVQGGGQGDAERRSHKDAPSVFNNGVVDEFEVCAVCRYQGKDKVLGCITFSYFTGERGKAGKDREIRGLDKNKLEFNGQHCYGKKSAPVGNLYEQGIEQWRKQKP